MSNKYSNKAKKYNSLVEVINRSKTFERCKKRLYFVVRLSLRKREIFPDLTRNIIYEHVIVMPVLRELIVAQVNVNLQKQNQDYSFVIFIITKQPTFERTVYDHMSHFLIGTPVKITSGPSESLKFVPEITIEGLIRRNFSTTVFAVTRDDHNLRYGRAPGIDPSEETLLDFKKFHSK